MTKKYLSGFLIGHFWLSLGAFLGLNGWLLAAQDGGTEAAGAVWIAWLVNFVLLQPLAHWILAAFPFAWWTWPGLLMLAGLLACNSSLLAAVLWLLRARFAAWRRSSRTVKL